MMRKYIKDAESFIQDELQSFFNETVIVRYYIYFHLPDKRFDNYRLFNFTKVMNNKLHVELRIETFTESGWKVFTSNSFKCKTIEEFKCEFIDQFKPILKYL